MVSEKLKILRNKQSLQKGNLPPILMWHGDVEKFLDNLPSEETFDLVITSPPYNIGKPYEKKNELRDYLEWQKRVIGKCLDRLNERGSICWQVGNYLEKGNKGKANAIMPLDILFFEIFRSFGLKLRNRIIWHFGHGLHCKHRFSGRYEVVLWFTKTDDYYFDLDAVRVKPKYPGKKHFKGPRIGQYSSNPKGKNPEDLWEITDDMLTAWDVPVWEVPNVKSNHIEKTIHPCQFPIELAERLILALSNKNDLIVDPYAGVGTTLCAALKNKRRSAGSEIKKKYVNIAKKRIKLFYIL